MSKFLSVVQVLEERIEHGDYLIREFPSERKLADETGVSNMTARKVTQSLLEKGLLHRKKNGRLAAASPGCKAETQIAFVSPAYSSFNYYRWMAQTITTANSYDLHIRPFEYMHFNDVVIQELLNSVDGVFLIPKAESIPDYLLKLMQESTATVVSLCYDLTSYGIPSLLSQPLFIMDQLLNHLKELGHRRIMAFNTQPVESVVTNRLNRINSAGKELGLDIEIVNDPVKSFGNPLEQAVHVFSNIIAA